MNTRDARGTVRVTVALVNTKVGGNAPIKGNVVRVLTFRNATVSETVERLKQPIFRIFPK